MGTEDVKVTAMNMYKYKERLRLYKRWPCSTYILKRTRCFREAYTGLPVLRATENQKALNCVVLKYSIPVSEE